MADAHESNNARCARCGAAFRCGAQEAACDCAQVELDAATLARLHADHGSRCLCNACLRALGAGEPAAPAADTTTPIRAARTAAP